MNNTKNKVVNKKTPNPNNKGFSDIKFLGKFRDYQQKVINSVQKHFKDGKIHIVAAPGSGKTILGLELVRMLGKPALILSPTIAIREQWKDRFEEMFLPAESLADDYVSCSLKSPKLLTSITYQGLYTSYRRIAETSPKRVSDSDEINDSPLEDYSAIDILTLMKELGISTVCLDEAHHLRAEWQRALTEFIKKVEHEVTIISLTATPPYDSKRSEWNKYISICGPIDEEIFVPELVKANNLCPHQDFVCYNFPTKNELDVIERYKNSVNQTMAEIFANGEFLSIIKNSEFYKDPKEFEDELIAQPEFTSSVIAFCNQHKEEPNKALLKITDRSLRNIKWDLSVAQTLFGSIIADDHLFSDEDRDFVKGYLSKHGLIEKNQVNLITNNEIERLLVSSVGKLNSISKIVDEEEKSLGEKLRLLVLTDYIRVNSSVLGSEKEIKEMGVIPIFELLRRKNKFKLAAISGKIVIVPNECIDEITQIAKKNKAKLKVIPIKNTQHSELRFEGAKSAQKIALITKAFNDGVINAIVGTKSLLGEGWDSPVINSLILASFVGSFMLSNQMRGRAIRIDKNSPDKVSNIWHLTSILPAFLTEADGELPDPPTDYGTLSRRFGSFLGLSYHNNTIENGLLRANTLESPFDEKNVEAANIKTFNLAKNRELTKKRWVLALSASHNEVLLKSQIQKPTQGFFPTPFIKPSLYSTIKKVTYAVTKTFKQLKLINKKARPLVEKDWKTKTVTTALSNCSQYEKNIFNQAISEALSPIDNPRYLLVKRRFANPDFRTSFAVPEIFANKKENAEVFNQKMRRRIAPFEAHYTRNRKGERILANAKKMAYVNKYAATIESKIQLQPKKSPTPKVDLAE